jgi:hypothetical protein
VLFIGLDIFSAFEKFDSAPTKVDAQTLSLVCQKCLITASAKRDYAEGRIQLWS